MEKIQQIHGILGFFRGDKMDVFFYNCCYRNYSSYLIEKNIYECILLTSLELWSLGSSFYDVSWKYSGSWEVNPGPLKVISTSSAVNFGSHERETVEFTLSKNIQQTV